MGESDSDKYKVGDIHNRSWAVLKGTWSSTWRSIAAGVWDVIRPGHGWVLGNGRNISFWTDKWLMGQSLLDSATAVIPEALVSMKAYDLGLTEWDGTCRE
ncbi:unnamed protein product [Microthlaspi erraticum]|uniref:Reverse transcriptase zinc-binding domain-containing protein n=1 Tax=Microthlaspi erraticum TaxID=1685480 RepID=A0A6D2HI40_9BRAS|nr:unnamed protein product [Microthlaspi erraticum]